MDSQGLQVWETGEGKDLWGDKALTLISVDEDTKKYVFVMLAPFNIDACGCGAV